MILTDHARERGNERTGLPLKAFEKLADKAFKEGLRHDQVTGQLKGFYNATFLSHNGKANNIRVYGEHVYLFRNDILITVIHLPNDLKAIARKIKRRCAL